MSLKGNLIAPDEDVATFSQHEIDERILGSKLVLVVEQMQIITVWLIKACLLLMYSRVTYVSQSRRYKSQAKRSEDLYCPNTRLSSVSLYMLQLAL